VYYNPSVVEHKRLEKISIDDVQEAFGSGVHVVNTTQDVLAQIQAELCDKQVILFMTSGNFDGVDLDELGKQLA
jgi:UDP-N-acetylmuramate: L-alanyl-gamma-D-glutamyl-meso-diaminopimelate ligase